MIPAFIPSKDRASQLLLLLESINRNSPNTFTPYIMHTSSNEEFEKGYNIAKDCAERNNIWSIWDKEKDCENQFYRFLEGASAQDSLVCLFSDDCIFYRKNQLTEKEINGMMGGSDGLSSIFSFTFRLGGNISVRDYVDQREADWPKGIGYTPWYFFWEWNKIDFWDMFGFTVGFDGYIYRAKELLELSDRSSFEGRICFWERMICQKFQQKKESITRRSMAAPYRSSVFIQQINVTHEFGHRTNNQFHYSKEELNRKLLDGYKIDLESMDFSNINCTHGELPFEFKEM